MNLIDRIKRDRKAGTDGPWLRENATVYALMHSGWRKGVEEFKNRFSCHVQHDQKDSTPEEAKANARRIASVPEMEAALLAAHELADVSDEVIQNADRLGEYADPMVSMPLSVVQDLSNALKAYRKTIEAQP